MISMSKSREGQALQAVVVVAYDRVTGHVHGSFVHGSLGGPDEAGVKRSSERFMAELNNRLGEGADLDTLQLPFDEVKTSWVDHVDPATRKPVKRGRDTTIINRP